MTVDTAAETRVPHGDVPADDPRILALGLEEPASTAAVFRNLERIKPLLREQAPEGDTIGRTTPLAGRAMRSSGLFRLAFPKSRGGLQASIADQLEIVTQVARIDGGTGWTVAILNASGWYGSFLDDESYAEIYPGGVDTPTAFSGWPAAKAVEDGDHFRIEKGRWNWGSGGYHVERWLGGAKVYDAEGNPVLDDKGRHKYLGIWLPHEKVRRADNWNPLGVRGSGSSSYYLTEPVRVPQRWSFDYYDMTRPYAFPLMGVPVGLVQHMLDLTVDGLRTRGRGGAPVGARDRAVLSEVLSDLDLLVFGLRGIARFADDVRAERRSGLLTDDECEWMDTIGYPVRAIMTKARELTQDIYGSGYVDAGSEFARILRDSHVAMAHAQFRYSDSQHPRGSRVDRMIESPQAGTSIWDAGWPLDVARPE